MKTFWLGYLIVVALIVLYFTGAFGEPYQGLFCLTETASEEVAVAYQKGGYDLEDTVADSLVEKKLCLRVEGDIDVNVVYVGKVIGDKAVIGVSRDPHGKPELFGLVPYPMRRGST